MKNNYRVMKHTKVGEVSSKYGYSDGGKRFEADMKAHKERGDFLWAEFIAFMKSHNATPEDFRVMFVRYHEEFID